MNEKTRYGFLRLLLLTILAVYSTATISAQVKVTNLSQLKAGSVIKIYPKDSNGTSHYGESSKALACNSDGNVLTSYEKAGSGDSWTLVDAGSGGYYLKNNLGCYWAYQSRTSSSSLTCTTSQSSAVRISLTWDSTYGGVCFWNQQDGTGLNNLNGYGYRFNWWSSKSDYTSDANTTFDIALISDEGGDYKSIEITDNGIKYSLNLRGKTAEVLSNNYSGDIVIPQSVTYDGIDYTVTSLEDKCFEFSSGLTSITLPNSITSLGDRCFYSCHRLTSVTLPNSITSLGNECFSGCSGLTSVTLPNSIMSLSDECFSYCRSLTSITLPDGITSLGKNCFSDCRALTSVTLPNCITSLGKNCFYNCTSLPSITLPDGITSLGERCFSYCRSLTSITLPNSITSLENYCFVGCASLKELSLPASLKNIGLSVLSGIDNNIVISCLAQTPPESRYGDFINSKHRLFVPKESLEKYKSTSPWSKAYSINPLYPATSVVLPAEASVVKTKTITLNYSILPENAGTKTVTWSSENPDIASVDAAGVITGKKAGTAKILAMAADGTDVSASTTVTILPLPVEVITFADQKVSVTKTKSATVTVRVNPAEADYKSITWTSSDESVATVAQSADASKPLEAIVTGMKVGKAIIKAEAQDGSGVTATCEVEVTPLPVSDFTTNTNSVVKTIPTKMEMEVTPTAADNKKLKWTSLTTEIAAVTEDGTVTGLKMGTAQLKAETTDGSKISKTFNVEVTGLPVSTISFPTTPISVVKTKTGKIPVTVEPQAADNQKLSWSSSNTEIATIDANGVVTGKEPGSAMITAKTTDGSNVSASVKVTIEPLKVESMTFAAPNVSVVKTNHASVTLTLNSEQVDNKKMVWTSSDESVATVEQDMTASYPLKAIVTAKKVGKATIKAEAQDGSGISATCEVEVTPLLVSGISAKTTSVVKTVPTKMDVTITPTEADNKKLKWTSLTPNVASATEDGTITGQKVGTAKLKAETTDGSNIEKTFEVEVAPLLVNAITLPSHLDMMTLDTKTLSCSILPEAADNKKLTWSSNAPSIASVDAEGKVTALKTGKVVITATATDGSGVSASCSVTITNPATDNLSFDCDVSNHTAKLQKTTYVGDVIVPEYVEYLGQQYRITSFADDCFADCPDLKSVTFLSATPLDVTEKALEPLSTDKVKVYVSAEAYETYFAANYWKSSSLYTIGEDDSLAVVVLKGVRYQLRKGKEEGYRATVLPDAYTGKVDVPQTVMYRYSQYVPDSIAPNAFAQTNGVALTIPVTVQKYGRDAFKESTDFGFDYQGDISYWLFAHFENGEANPISASGKLIINGKEINRVNVPVNCKDMLPYTFYGCTSLDSLKLNVVMNSIAEGCFANCGELKYVYSEPTTPPLLAEGAFAGTTIAELRVPSTHYDIYCKAPVYGEAQNIYTLIDDVNTDLVGFHSDGMIFTVDRGKHTASITRSTMLAGGSDKTYEGNITIPDNVVYNKESYPLEAIDDECFNGCQALEKLVMPASIKKIGGDAFSMNTKMSFDYLGTLENWMKIEFANASSNPVGETGHLVIQGKDLGTSLTIPSSITEVLPYTFVGCKTIEELEVGKHVEKFDGSAFTLCSNIKTLKYFGPSLNKTINPFNGSDGDKPCPITHLETSDNALVMTASAYASTLEEVVLDDDYDGSSNYLGFANCKKLRSVQLGRNVTVIGGPLGGAFENCSALEEITLPEAVTLINANAFKGCISLKKLYFGGELYNSTIGKDAFYDCKNLELVDFNGDIVDWSGMEFENKYANPMFYAKKVLIDGNELEELQLPEGCGINSFKSYAFVNLKSLKRVIAGAEMGVFPYSVFEGCSNLEEIQLHLQGAPATAMRGSFDGVDKNTCVLRVPADQIAAYKRQYIWKDFLNIEALPVYVENIYFTEVPNDMTVGDKQTLHIMIEPANAENKDIEWLSSDDAIATVDEQGVVTAIAEGTVYITAAAKDASGVSARCVINVTEPTGIGYINTGDVKLIISKRHLSIVGLAKDDVIQVINMNGLTVYMGTKHEIDLDAEGVYIIKVKGKALKFRVK